MMMFIYYQLAEATSIPTASLQPQHVGNNTRTKRDIGSLILAELRDFVAGPFILLGDIIDYARYAGQASEQVRKFKDLSITYRSSFVLLASAQWE